MKNSSDGMHSNKNSLSISGEESDGLTFGLKMFRGKETPINYYAAIILITEMWQNISGENLRLLNSKILSIFGSTWATFVNAHFLQCRVSSNTSACVLQTAIYNHNFIVLLLI